MVAQATHEVLEGLSDSVFNGEVLTLRFGAERRNSSYVRNGYKGHVRTTCETKYAAIS